MSLSKKASTTRRRRILEVALLIALAACLALALSPLWKAQEKERADRHARAQAMMNSTNEAVSTFARVAPAVVGVTVSAAAGAKPEQILQNMAPLEIEEATQQLKDDPNNPDLLSERGDLYLTTRQSDKAFADFTRALELQPSNNGWACRGRAEALAQQGRYAKALADAKAATLCQDYRYTIDAWITLGYVCVGLGEYESAIEAYDQALDIYGEERAWFGRATALRHLGQEEEARRDFSFAEEHHPGFQLTWAPAIP